MTEFFQQLYQQSYLCVMAGISSFFFYLAARIERTAANSSLTPHERNVALANRAGYRIVAWTFTGFTTLYFLVTVVY